MESRGVERVVEKLELYSSCIIRVYKGIEGLRGYCTAYLVYPEAFIGACYTCPLAAEEDFMAGK